MFISKNSFESSRHYTMFFLGAFAGVVMIRIMQRSLSYQPAYQSWDPERSSLRHRTTRDGFGEYFLDKCNILSNKFLELCGVEYRRRGPHEELAQLENFDTLCKALIEDMAPNKKAHWVTAFSHEKKSCLELILGSNNNCIETMTQKHQVLKLIFRLNDITQHRSINPYFCTVVKTVVGPSLADLSEKHVTCIEGVWILLDAFDRGENATLIETMFEIHPMLLEILIQAIAPQGFLLKHFNPEQAAKSLDRTNDIFLFNPDFYCALSAHRTTKIKESSSIPDKTVDLVNIAENELKLLSLSTLSQNFLNAATSYNAEAIPAKIKSRIGENAPAELKMLQDYYEKQWAIYNIEFYLIAVLDAWTNYLDKNPSSSRNTGLDGPILQLFAQNFKNLLEPAKNDVEGDIASICFRRFIEHYLQNSGKWENSDTLHQVTVQLTSLLDPIKPISQNLGTRTDQIREANNLHRIKCLVFEVAFLLHQGLKIDTICSILSNYCQAGIHLLRNPNPMINVRNILRSMRKPRDEKPIVIEGISLASPQLSTIASTQRHQVLVKIQNDPFLCVSKLALPFIKGLLPEKDHGLIDKFIKHMGILKRLFDKSPLREEIINTVKDPAILAFLIENGFDEMFCRVLNKACELVSAHFSRVAKGEVQIGTTTLTEKPVHLLIEKIVQTHKLRILLRGEKIDYTGKEARAYLELSGKADKFQIWLLNELPEDVQKLSSTLQVLSFTYAFMGISFGPLNVGTPLLVKVLATLADILKWDSVWELIIKGLQENDPNGAFAKLLEDLTPEEKAELVTFLKECLIPLAAVLGPALEKRHKNLEQYKGFLQYLSKRIHSPTNINEKELVKELAKVLAPMMMELKEYGPQLDAAFKSLWQSEM
jgi:hypothetical protein